MDAPRPRRYADYATVDGSVLESACLYLAAVLADLMRTQLTIVGGYVPPLLIPQEELPEPQRHCGTMDLDVGLSIALLDNALYETVARRLRQSGFRPDVNPDGNRTRQRWCTPADHPAVTVDFLIPSIEPGQTGGSLQNLTGDFAALRMPGLQLVERDFAMVTLSGSMPDGTRISRKLRVCGAGAFAVLKARAIQNRDEPKDAFDLHYTLEHFAGGVPAVAEALRPLMDDDDATQAIAWLDTDYESVDSIGPVRVSMFLTGGKNDVLQGEAWALVRELIRLLRK